MRKLVWGLLAGLLVTVLGLGCWDALERHRQRQSTPEAIVALVWETFEAQEGVAAVETEIVPTEGGGITTTVRVTLGEAEIAQGYVIDGAEVAELLEQVGTTLAPQLRDRDLDGLYATVVWKRQASHFSATYSLSDLIKPEFFVLSSPERQQLRAASWYPGWNVSVAVDRAGFVVTHRGTGGRHRQTIGEILGSSRGFNREIWSQAGWQVTVVVNGGNEPLLSDVLSIADSLPEVPEEAGAAMSYAPVGPKGQTNEIYDHNPHELLITGLGATEISDSDIATLVGRIDAICSATSRTHLLDEVWLSWTDEARSDSSLSYTCGDTGLKVPDQASSDFDAPRSTEILDQGRQS